MSIELGLSNSYYAVGIALLAKLVDYQAVRYHKAQPTEIELRNNGGLLGDTKDLQSGLDLSTNTLLDVNLEARIGVLLESVPHVLLALLSKEPSTRGKVVLVDGNSVEQFVEVVIRHAVNGVDTLKLGCKFRNGLCIEKVVVGHLHVGCTLAGSAGDLVALVLEVARLKSHEGKYSGHHLGVINVVVLEGIDEERRSLFGGAAVFISRGAAL
ncbi:hypothetical protein HG531_010823 [Fusarium graminearum]|nr:hypothetical protein HG531_010823 [Fusarium graminearum]